MTTYGQADCPACHGNWGKGECSYCYCDHGIEAGRVNECEGCRVIAKLPTPIPLRLAGLTLEQLIELDRKGKLL